MKRLAGIALAAIVMSAAGTYAAGPWNPYKGMKERQEVFEFTTKPSVKKKGDGYEITFASKAACDATVAVLDAKGTVVRHLASGVLGANAPAPFTQGNLSQTIEWDGKTDDGATAPPGCRVRVSLGLDAEFDALETWQLMSGIRPLAVDGEGQVYAVGKAGTPGAIHIFGTDGKYVRTVFPPPAFATDKEKISPDRFAPITWNTTAAGDRVPRRHRHGGGFDFDLTGYPDLFGNLASGTVTSDGKLCVLYAPKRGSAKLFIIDVRDGSCPKEAIVDLGEIVTNGMAASPDGKWLYFAGRPPHPWEKHNPFSHAVMRTSLTTPGPPKVFLGDIKNAGNDNTHFSGPSSVACDKNGNLYVGDLHNGRIQVFSPDGTYKKTIPGAAGLIGVSHATGAIYLLTIKGDWTHNPIIVKLGGLDKPEKVTEFEFACGQNWKQGSAAAILSTATDPPILWFAGSPYDTRRNPPVITGVEDRGAALARTVDLLKVNTTPNAGGDVTGPGMWASLHADRKANTARWAPVDAKGLLYSRGMYYEENKQCLFRFAAGTAGERSYVSFENGEPAFALAPTGACQMLSQDGKPVIGPRMYHARGSHLHQGPFCVAPNGDIYMGVTYSKEIDAEMEKAGLPRLTSKLGAVSAPALRVYGPDGILKSPNALPGLAELEGLRVGRSGAVYVVQPWKPGGQTIPEGLGAGASYEDSRWGSLIKFAGDFKTFPVGRVIGAWEAAPSDPTHHGAGMKVKLENALWTYGGVSPHSAKYSACTCMKASADLDDYERSFVCAVQTCTVNVIDSNGNVMARIGGYGNVDSRGEDSPVLDPKTGVLRPRREDDPKDLKSPLRPLGFCLPRNAAASDDKLWVADTGHRALVRTSLVYRAEETVDLP